MKHLSFNTFTSVFYCKVKATSSYCVSITIGFLYTGKIWEDTSCSKHKVLLKHDEYRVSTCLLYVHSIKIS